MTPQQQFWNWFQANEASLRTVVDQPEGLGKVFAKLAEVDANLTCEVGKLSEGQFDFVVSCGGISEGIPAVQALCAAAPAIPDWQVTAFKQPKNMDWSIRLGEMEINPLEVRAWFDDEDPNRVDVALLFPAYDEEWHDAFGNITFILLDNLIGEYGVMTRIGGVEFGAIEDAADPGSLVTLEELKAVIEKGN